MKEINVVIVDELVAQRIKNVLNNISKINNIKVVTNVDDLYNELIKDKTDILFLDASVKYGIQVIEKMIDEKRNNIPYLIYTNTEPTQPTSNNTFFNMEIGALIKPYNEQ